MGKQKYIRMMEGEANPKRGQKRQVQAEDRAGKSARSSASAAPMTPGGLEGEDAVTMATMNGEDYFGGSHNNMLFGYTARSSTTNTIRCKTEMCPKAVEEDMTRKIFDRWTQRDQRVQVGSEQC